MASQLLGAERQSTEARPSPDACHRFFSLSPDLLCVAGFDGYFKELSPSWSRLLGHQPGELTERPYMDFVHPDDVTETRQVAAALTEPDGQVIAFVNRYRHADGSYRWLEWSAVSDMESRCIHAVARDVTERICDERRVARCNDQSPALISARRRADAELLRAKEAAESASRAKSAFLATMSHEMRTPLHAIVGFTELLTAKCREVGDAESKAALEAIQHSTELLTALVDSTLELALIESGRLEVSSEPCDVRELVESMMRSHREQLAQADLELECRIADNVPAQMLSDRACLQRILGNLMSNAIKFSPQGKRIELRCAREADFLLLQVRDQGIGIRAEMLDTIFDKFVQGDATLTRRYGGTGLGLTIIREIVELLHGTIEVHSVPGQGSTFSVRLPCVEPATPAPARVAEHSAESRALPRFSSAHRVLLVEDNPINRKVAKGLFARLGLDIALANDGQEGVRLAGELRPDIIFMDIHMPVMGGLEAARRIRERPELAKTPIVALSADAFLGQDDTVTRAGITEYLTKPLLLQQLAATLCKHLRPLDS